MKYLFSLAGISMSLLTFNNASAQLYSKGNDSLIQVVGKVINHYNQQPLKAKIIFEKLPNGDDLHIVNSDGAKGFNLLMRQNQEYSVEIKESGFISYFSKLKIYLPIEANNVVHEFVLIPNEPGQILRMENLLFKQSQAEIVPSSYQELNHLVDLLLENPKMVIQLEGHTEPRGSSTLNLRLSQKRVEAVRDYLVDNGVKKSRIRLKAFGGSMPLTNENTEDAIKKNRRVEVRILSI
jgi:OmpA-OmpF porin, OOP family